MNKKVIITLLATILITLTSLPASANLKSAKVALVSGNWKVLHDKDMMTDKTDCTGIYKNNYGIQLTKDTLYISVPGGIQSVTLRFGDEPAQPFRLATEMEKKVGVIILTGSVFQKLQSVSRLRYQSSTLVDSVKSGDLDLTGLATALNSIKSGCPLRLASATTPKKTKAHGKSLCNSALVNRMRKHGLKDSEIDAICR